MPTYSYACKDCGHAFDIVQSFSDDALTVCPECGGALRKQFNSVGVVFKGSGFYRNDSREAPAKASTGDKTEGGKTDGAKSEGGKTDTGKSDGAKADKPAAPAANKPASTPAKSSGGSAA